MSSSDPAKAPSPAAPRRRWGRRIAIGSIVSLFALVALVALLPTLLSGRWAAERLRVALEAELDAPVTVGDVTLSWSDVQRVDSLRLGDPRSFEGAARGDVLVAEGLRVPVGLLGLLLGGGDVPVHVEQARLRVATGPGGRTNLEGLVGGSDAAGADAREGGAPTSSEVGDDSGAAGRGVRLRILRTDVSFQDGDAEAHPVLVDHGLEIEARGSGGVLRLSPPSEAASPTPSVGSRLASSVEWGRAAAGIEARGDGELRSIDLGPFRRLLRERAGWEPPAEPVSGRVDATLRGDLLTIRGELATAQGSLRDLDWSLPLAPADGAAMRIATRFDVDGRKLVAAIPALAEPLGETALSGALGGRLELAIPWGEDAAAPLRIALEASATGLHIVAPATETEDHADGDATSDTEDAAASAEVTRREWREQSVALTLRASGRREWSIEEARVRADGVDLALAGTVAPAEDTPRGDWRLSLDGRAEMTKRRLDALAPGWLPAGVELTDDLALKVEGLRLSGLVGGEADWRTTLELGGDCSVSGSGTWRGLLVEGTRSRVSWRDGALRFEDAAARANGGEVTAKSVEIDLGGERVAWSVDVALQGVGATVDLSPVLAYVLPFLALEESRGELRGGIDAKITFRGAGFGLEELRETLRGEGEVALAKGHFVGSKVFGEIAKLLGEDVDRVLFERTGSRFSIADGVVRAGSVFLEPKAGSKVRNLGLEGVTDFDGRLDYGVNLADLEKTIGDKRIRRILEKARVLLGDGGFPLRLGGTLTKPTLALAPILGSLSPDAGGEEPVDTREVLERAIGGGLQRAADELLDLLRKGKKKDER